MAIWPNELPEPEQDNGGPTESVKEPEMKYAIEKSQKSHDTAYVWDINLEATNEQDKQTETHGHGQ